MSSNEPVLKSGELLAREIRNRIARRELLPGDHLPPEDELIASLGVARTTVREGLRILESQGLIEVRRGRKGGGRICYPTLDHLAQTMALTLQLEQVTYVDLHEAGVLIEPSLAGALARAHSAEDVSVLRAIVDRAEAAAEADDREAFGEAAAALHQAVVDRAGNKTLAVIGRLLHELIFEYYGWASAQTPDAQLLEQAVKSYRRLVDLIVQGDDVGAEEHWRRQLDWMRNREAENDPPLQFSLLAADPSR